MTTPAPDPSPTPDGGVYEMSPDELAERQQGPQPPVVVDVREPWEHQIARIAGARLVPLGFAFPLLAWSVPSMVVLLIPAGGLLSAFFATRNELAGIAAAPGTETEAVTWPLTALIAGMAVGAALAGVVAEGPGWRAAIAGAVASAALGSAAASVRRGTLVPAT